MRLAAFGLTVAWFALGCSGKKDDQEGLPAKGEWQAKGTASPTGASASPHGAAAPAVPPGHPGFEDDELARIHAGVDMQQAIAPAAAGMPEGQGGAAVAEDENSIISGFIQVADPLKSQIKGGVLFVVVRQVDGNGQVQRMPLAAEIIEGVNWPQPFRISNVSAMASGSGFVGKVEVSARLDQDGDASTKQVGDLEGEFVVDPPKTDAILSLSRVRTEASGMPAGGAAPMPAGHP